MVFGNELSVNLVDLPARQIMAARVKLDQGRIVEIQPLVDRSIDDSLPFMLPGFIDAHIHIESSMLVPSEFARMAVRHGTIATVSDPHEIANVMGIAGVDFMIENGAQTPLKFFFGAPSCVPATSFETSGATIDAAAVQQLLSRDDILYLAEMMNYPGVLNEDREVLQKLQAAKRVGKPVDGHAPGLVGEDAQRYVAAGISTDHECTTLAEAEHKLSCGMKILVREGSAAKNFDALYPLIDRYPASIMLCSDDKHPDALADSHINTLVQRAVNRGCDLFNVLAAACINPIDHYRLPLGRLRVGDPADFVLVKDLTSFEVTSTFIDGRLVFDRDRSAGDHVLFDRTAIRVINHFRCDRKTPADFATPADSPHQRVIKAIDGSLVTEAMDQELELRGGRLQTDVDRDVLKLAVVNRYRDAAPATCFVQGFGIRDGAIASSVGHDSHNIIAVGTSDDHLCAAVNAVIDHQGGIALASMDQLHVLPLAIAGIMSTADGDAVAADYARIDQLAKQMLGSRLSAPFMTLSFMALLVIPALKLSDRGLFDSQRFRFVQSQA
jgi:adenine deaminase